MWYRCGMCKVTGFMAELLLLCRSEDKTFWTLVALQKGTV